MKKLDILWSENEKYYHREGFRIIIHDGAPDYVKKSFDHYVKQCKELGEKDEER